MNVHDSVVAKALDNSRVIPRDLAYTLTVRDQWENLLSSQSIQELVRTEQWRSDAASTFAEEAMGHSAIDHAIEATSFSAQYAKIMEALAPSTVMRLANLDGSVATSQESLAERFFALDAAHAIQSAMSEHADTIQRQLNRIMNFAASQLGSGAISVLGGTTSGHLQDLLDEVGVDRRSTGYAAVPERATDTEAEENRSTVASTAEEVESAPPIADEETFELTCELWRTAELILKVGRRLTLQAHQKKLPEAILSIHGCAGRCLAPHDVVRLVEVSNQFCEHCAILFASPGSTLAEDGESPVVEWAELVIANCRELRSLVHVLANNEWPQDNW